jgi:hypothetical protein
VPDRLPEPSPEFAVCGFVRHHKVPRRFGVLVASPGGTGRLRIDCGPFGVTPPGYRDSRHREEVLVLDDQPLIRVQGTECPTCPRLLQAGLGMAASRDLARLMDITVDSWELDPFECARRLEPILQLLPPANYRISLEDHAPTDGEGHLFWRTSPQPEDSMALRWISDAEPCFLTATQSTTKFNPAAWERAKQTFRTHPLLALELGGGMSAVLDGHHRALAVANAGALMPALVVCQYYSGNTDWLRDRNSTNANFRPVEQSRPWATTLRREVDQAVIDRHLSALGELDHRPLPTDVVPQRLDDAYPTFLGAAGYWALVSTYGGITDRAVDDILSGRVENLAVYRPESTFETLINTLVGRRDPRSIEIAQRILKDYGWVWEWRYLAQQLASWPCDEVDDIFVEYLCRTDEPDRPDLVATIDEYFRRRAAGAQAHVR